MGEAADIGHQYAPTPDLLQPTQAFAQPGVTIEPLPCGHDLVHLPGLLQGIQPVFGNDVFPLPVAQHVQGPVSHDGINPSACRTTAGPVLMGVGPDAKESLLHHLLGKIVPPQDALRDRDQPAGLAVIDSTKAVSVACRASEKGRFEIARQIC